MPTDPSTTTGTVVGTTATDPAATTPHIAFAPDGSITGVDGLLNQIAGALARQAVPLIRTELLPALEQNTAIQDRIGAAAGREAVRELKPYLWTVTGAVVLAVGVYLYRGRSRPQHQLED